MADAARVDLSELHKRAARVASRAETLDVRMIGCQAARGAQAAWPHGLSYRLSSEPSAEWFDSHESFVVGCEYNLEIAAAPKDENADPYESDERVAVIEFRLAAMFEIDQSGQNSLVSDQELDAYALTTGQFLLYPYAREFVSDMTARLGLPKLTMGVFRLDLEAGDVADIHEASESK